MNLFKRLIMSLFPDDMNNGGMNPASMFVSFISTKEFFSVINRKLVDNYKMNLFDISIDPIEFQIGFGDNFRTQKEKVDLYYSYCAAANLNGYRFFNIGNIGYSITMISTLLADKTMQKYKSKYYRSFLLSTYLILYLFAARIKQFPFEDYGKNYNRFIELFFSFYEFICKLHFQKGETIDIQDIKQDILTNTSVCKLLFAINYEIKDYFLDNTEEKLNLPFFERILKEKNNKKTNAKHIINDFLKNYQKTSKKHKLFTAEKVVISKILPIDILIKYLFHDMDISMMNKRLFAKIYDEKKIQTHIKHIDRKGELEELLLYLTDPNMFKSKFFTGTKVYINTFFNQGKSQYSAKEDMEEILSEIGNDMSNIGHFKIPERIKQESMIMEKFLNFYISFMGGISIARGDAGYMSIFQSNLLKQYKTLINQEGYKTLDISYYASYYHIYHRNEKYYETVQNNIKSGKTKFYIQIKSHTEENKINPYITSKVSQNGFATLIQDINAKDIRLYVQKDEIIQDFQKNFGKEIVNITKKNKKNIITYVYGNVFNTLGMESMTNNIAQELKNREIKNIKNNLYSLDFQIFFEILQNIDFIKELSKQYSNKVIINILGNIRETLSGFLLYYQYLKGRNRVSQSDLDILLKIYIHDVLYLNKRYIGITSDMIIIISKQIESLLTQWLLLDDNKQFLRIAYNNLMQFKTKKGKDYYKNIGGEDVLRLRGFLKNITYYNKRFLIPK